MIQKMMIIAAGAFLTLSANAAPKTKNTWPSKSVVIVCNPATKVYPMNEFTLTLDEKKSKLELTFSKASGFYDGDPGMSGYLTTDKNDIGRFSLGILKVRSVEVDEFTDGTVERVNTKVYADFNDWGAVDIEIGSDDDGYAAFVYFYSDGPSIRSFYRCELK